MWMENLRGRESNDSGSTKKDLKRHKEDIMDTLRRANESYWNTEVPTNFYKKQLVLFKKEFSKILWFDVSKKKANKDWLILNVKHKNQIKFYIIISSDWKEYWLINEKWKPLNVFNNSKPIIDRFKALAFKLETQKIKNSVKSQPKPKNKPTQKLNTPSKLKLTDQEKELQEAPWANLNPPKASYIPEVKIQPEEIEPEEAESYIPNIKHDVTIIWRRDRKEWYRSRDTASTLIESLRDLQKVVKNHDAASNEYLKNAEWLNMSANRLAQEVGWYIPKNRRNSIVMYRGDKIWYDNWKITLTRKNRKKEYVLYEDKDKWPKYWKAELQSWEKDRYSNPNQDTVNENKTIDTFQEMIDASDGNIANLRKMIMTDNKYCAIFQEYAQEKRWYPRRYKIDGLYWRWTNRAFNSFRKSVNR